VYKTCLQASKFVVDVRAVCIWEENSSERGREFLRGFDFEYFRHVANICAGNSDGEKRHAAALSLRMTYSQALESLFAFLCAFIQAPHCVHGWLTTYQNCELYSLVEDISKRRKVYSVLPMNPITWEDLASIVHEHCKPGNIKPEDVIRSFGQMWRRLAKDFLNKTLRAEYNSIKHGLRAIPGGSVLTCGEYGSDKEMVCVGNHEFGSSFPVMKSIGKSKLDFIIRQEYRSWSPAHLASRIHLISMSLNNIIGRLRLSLEEPAENVRFRVPQSINGFNSPWADSMAHVEFHGVSYNIPELVPSTEVEILSSYPSPPAQNEIKNRRRHQLR